MHPRSAHARVDADPPHSQCWMFDAWCAARHSDHASALLHAELAQHGARDAQAS
jgi:hypothetical protein